MSTQDENNDRIELLQGTLALLILRTLVFGRQHGQGIARAIQQSSGEVLLVDHGSLYPALQRLEAKGLVEATWGTSENNSQGCFTRSPRAGGDSWCVSPTAGSAWWRRWDGFWRLPAPTGKERSDMFRRTRRSDEDFGEEIEAHLAIEADRLVEEG